LRGSLLDRMIGSQKHVDAHDVAHALTGEKNKKESAGDGAESARAAYYRATYYRARLVDDPRETGEERDAGLSRVVHRTVLV
jgi:hypothetical protein